ncbi:MAG TPA: protein-L-isoaspartate(D-aspartate) O-methyltransferase [Treponemataceae bacterium]|nr:protein-L-isoaspartate(D-aspartate) O-methyltransferase [Treponemataceae bacterium]
MTADEAKNSMIRNQLEGRGMVDESVLRAFRVVDRLLFVPEGLARLAYADEPLPIGYGQTISQPFVVAIMTELLGLDKTSRVLEIGTGSGYQTAILSTLAREVVTMERIKELHESAKKLLDSLGYSNVRAVLGDGYGGYPDAAPYDGIVVTAAPPSIPEALLTELAPGGRLIVPIGTAEQMLVRVTKNKKGELTSENIFPVLFVPMRHG